ncbi:hypothetical protein WM40_12860 [Robbsia andropogonis]|uniref:Uncharacterized protein n=1 Tax=Robbsia andropogonis TaxID=28092 RepID=A0A0F5JZW7_9BURK|nr:hypothetical protein WM40_12860 [Robbsia andropogonis]
MPRCVDPAATRTPRVFMRSSKCLDRDWLATGSLPELPVSSSNLYANLAMNRNKMRAGFVRAVQITLTKSEVANLPGWLPTLLFHAIA